MQLPNGVQLYLRLAVNVKWSHFPFLRLFRAGIIDADAGIGVRRIIVIVAATAKATRTESEHISLPLVNGLIPCPFCVPCPRPQLLINIGVPVVEQLLPASCREIVSVAITAENQLRQAKAK